MALVLRTQSRGFRRHPVSRRIWLVEPSIVEQQNHVPVPRVEVRKCGDGHVVRIEADGVDWDRAEAVFDRGALEVRLPDIPPAEPVHIPVTRPKATD